MPLKQVLKWDLQTNLSNTKKRAKLKNKKTNLKKIEKRNLHGQVRCVCVVAEKNRKTCTNNWKGRKKFKIIVKKKNVV